MKARAQKSIAWAICPEHVAVEKTTGLIALDAHTLVFRDHTKKIGKHTMPCPGSGQIWEGETHDAPA